MFFFAKNAKNMMISVRRKRFRLKTGSFLLTHHIVLHRYAQQISIYNIIFDCHISAKINLCSKAKALRQKDMTKFIALWHSKCVNYFSKFKNHIQKLDICIPFMARVCHWFLLCIYHNIHASVWQFLSIQTRRPSS